MTKFGHEYKLFKRLKELGAEYNDAYIAYAKAEASYQSKKRQEILKMQFEGETATMISQKIKGVPEVNDLLEKRIVAEGNMKAKKEQINILKLEIRHLEAGIEKN